MHAPSQQHPASQHRQQRRGGSARRPSAVFSAEGGEIIIPFTKGKKKKIFPGDLVFQVEAILVRRKIETFRELWCRLL